MIVCSLSRVCPSSHLQLFRTLFPSPVRKQRRTRPLANPSPVPAPIRFSSGYASPPGRHLGMSAPLSPPPAQANLPPRPPTTAAQSRLIEIYLVGNEVVEFQLEQLAGDETEAHAVATLLEETGSDVSKWCVCVLELIRLGRDKLAEEMITKGLEGRPLPPPLLVLEHVADPTTILLLLSQPRSEVETSRARFRCCSSLPTSSSRRRAPHPRLSPRKLVRLPSPCFSLLPPGYRLTLSNAA